MFIEEMVFLIPLLVMIFGSWFLVKTAKKRAQERTK